VKFLVDMPLSPDLAEWLRAEGHDAVHANELSMYQSPDSEIRHLAAGTGRVVITADLDFPRLLAALGSTGAAAIWPTRVPAGPAHRHLPYNKGMSDRDLRNVVLLLVEAHKKRQSHAAALRVLVQAVVDESASRKTALTLAEVEQELQKILAQTIPVADAEARQVEVALKGESDFLEPLRVYASQQFWSPRPQGTL
jgi:hypothetical protein